MALLINVVRHRILHLTKQNLYTHTKVKVTTGSGAILPEPKKVSFGLPKIILTLLPGLYLGATFSKEGAAFLEENDIFVPDEDDDDD